ncbi:MAG: Cupin domain protein [Firmicutes bacterium ADurb.Bin182]|nr:MAG: Cupin domain protein [Firmicutes bacterium ADurb.Bin182]
MSEVFITRKEELAPSHKNEHEPFEYYKYEVTKRSEFFQVYIAFYEIPPLKSNYPYHYHTENTETFFILSGRGELRTPEGCRAVTTGDIIVIPPGAEGAHRLTNTSPDEVLQYIDFDTANYPDIVHYPDSEKTGILMRSNPVTVFKDGTEADYYDGE